MDKEALLDLLILSLDNELPAAQQEQLERALKEHKWLRQERDKLIEIRDVLGNMRAAPNDRFTDSVMAHIDAGSSGSESIIIRLFPKVAAACAVFLLALVLNIYSSDGSLSYDSIIGLNDLSPDEAYSYILSEDNN